MQAACSDPRYKTTQFSFLVTMPAFSPDDFEVASLGTCRYDTPLDFESPNYPQEAHFINDADRVRMHVRLNDEVRNPAGNLSLQEAGPRQRIFFDPPKTTAALVTCGGLSPGLNNVIRSVFDELFFNYGVPSVWGIRNGYFGLNPESGLEPIRLSREFVDPIDKLGGTVLGSSRGPQSPAVMADFLQSRGVDILFCIGGDGTQRGAFALDQELRNRKVPIGIIGIPKTIDNDIPFVSQSFGYATALEKAAEVIQGAHVEARDAINGIGLVKVMGRHSGSIAAGASLVSQEVDFTLVPEIPFPMDGSGGFLAALKRRLQERGHAVVVVAEGAGGHLLESSEERSDASGNRLHGDIGRCLQQRITSYFDEHDIRVALKYLDPSYFVRSVPANMFDRVLCNQMGRLAVHAAMAGKTGMMIGSQHGCFVHVPIPAVVSQAKTIDVRGDLWRAVLESTNQPRW